MADIVRRGHRISDAHKDPAGHAKHGAYDLIAIIISCETVRANWPPRGAIEYLCLPDIICDSSGQSDIAQHVVHLASDPQY